MADWLKGKGRLEAEARKAIDLASPLDAYMAEAGTAFKNLIREKIYEPQPRAFSPQSGITSQNAQGSQTMMAGINSIPTQDAGGNTLEITTDSEHTMWRNDGISGWGRTLDTVYSFKSQHPSIRMVQGIDDWMRARGVDPKAVSPWAIAYAVLRRGIEGHHFIENTFTDENMNTFEDALLTLVENNVQGRIERVTPNFK